ncbi:hypothetical protein NDK47_17955 [Brevibacillus ruminantium]|uniref:Uncharacterized protein n=1 Tax=Brevibacillus ruminantium TaxID=2950604 RepID=A0ABY4WA37_9BACL|nr:hypothetical protein [Brevibacillus ruminantium]USG64035.1 hypothetical protein NDK47_17955 [Brevibacillus ruminantium]
MDHVIRSIEPHLYWHLGMLRQEWRGGKGEYKKLTDCPSYAECKALVDAIHVLEKHEYGQAQTMSVSNLIDW